MVLPARFFLLSFCGFLDKGFCNAGRSPALQMARTHSSSNLFYARVSLITTKAAKNVFRFKALSSLRAQSILGLSWIQFAVGLFRKAHHER